MKYYSTEEQQRRAKINRRKRMLRMPLTVAEKIFKNIKDFYEDKIKYPVIWFIQRGKRGYCDRDTWDFERGFFSVAPKIIRDIEKHHFGVWLNGIHEFPILLNEEFIEMAECFEKANKIKHTFIDEPEYKEYEKYKKRGFELLNKYFDYLGW